MQIKNKNCTSLNYFNWYKQTQKPHPNRKTFNHINGNLYHYAGNNPVRYIDPTGMWTDKMKKVVEEAIALNKTYTHGTWNQETKKTENAWDCDVYVEYIVNSSDSGAILPSSFKEASETTVAQHLIDMKNELKDTPSKETNIVFHGGNHAMLLGLNEDGSVDVTHISSSNPNKKATKTNWPSIESFENHWKKQGNGELKYVPLNDFLPSGIVSKENLSIRNENEGSGK